MDMDMDMEIDIVWLAIWSAICENLLIINNFCLCVSIISCISIEKLLQLKRGQHTRIADKPTNRQNSKCSVQSVANLSYKIMTQKPNKPTAGEEVDEKIETKNCISIESYKRANGPRFSGLHIRRRFALRKFESTALQIEVYCHMWQLQLIAGQLALLIVLQMRQS